MNGIKRISVDTSKSVFTIHAVDTQDRPVIRRDLRRTQFEAFFVKQSPTEVVLEACGGSHYWGRVLTGPSQLVAMRYRSSVTPAELRQKVADL